MSLDNSAPAQESNGPLDLTQAASLFAGEQEKPAPEAKAPEAAAEPAKVDAEPAEPTEGDEPAEEVQKVTIQVDGKAVELTPEQIADAYKNGLRQEDYTRKTMAAAEQRKAAEAEASKAREERQQYAQGLQQAQVVLQAQLQEQSQIDWQKLLETDPVEYLKQQHLANTRQAQLQRVHGEQQQLHARHQAEQAEKMSEFIRTQQDELLAKLPEWKDESKAKSERAAIREYLVKQGFDDNALNNINDHRAVIMSRKAMLYDQMMSKAKAAAQKVGNLPQKVERPGTSETSATDGRTAAMRQLAKTGSVRDAAAALEKIFNT